MWGRFSGCKPAFRCSQPEPRSGPPFRAAFARAHSPLSGPQREPHRVRLGAHPLPREGGGRPGRDAGPRGTPRPRPFYRYRRHCERVIREAGQDPEEVVEVSAEQTAGAGPPWVPQPSPGQRASSCCCRSSSRRYAPRARPCATSPPIPATWCSCASPTSAASTTSPLCTSQRVPRQGRRGLRRQRG